MTVWINFPVVSVEVSRQAKGGNVITYIYGEEFKLTSFVLRAVLLRRQELLLDLLLQKLLFFGQHLLRLPEFVDSLLGCGRLPTLTAAEDLGQQRHVVGQCERQRRFFRPDSIRRLLVEVNRLLMNDSGVFSG